jgi:hypothetical protein
MSSAAPEAAATMAPEPVASSPSFEDGYDLDDRLYAYGSGGGGGAVQHMAMPRLLGAPAYARPPRMTLLETPRPFDPDDLPLEAERTDEEQQLARAYASSGPSSSNGHGGGSLRPSSSGGLRGIAARLLGGKA